MTDAKKASCSKSYLLTTHAANCVPCTPDNATACSLPLPLQDETAAKIWSPWSDSPAGSQPTELRDGLGRAQTQILSTHRAAAAACTVVEKLWRSASSLRGAPLPAVSGDRKCSGSKLFNI